MLTVETRQAVHPDFARAMDTATLRRHFLADGMFADGEIRLIYTHYDRFVMGAAVPAGGRSCWTGLQRPARLRFWIAAKWGS